MLPTGRGRGAVAGNGACGCGSGLEGTVASFVLSTPSLRGTRSLSVKTETGSDTVWALRRGIQRRYQHRAYRCRTWGGKQGRRPPTRDECGQEQTSDNSGVSRWKRKPSRQRQQPGDCRAVGRDPGGTRPRAQGTRRPHRCSSGRRAQSCSGSGERGTEDGHRI